MASYINIKIMDINPSLFISKLRTIIKEPFIPMKQKAVIHVEAYQIWINSNQQTFYLEPVKDHWNWFMYQHLTNHIISGICLYGCKG